MKKVVFSAIMMIAFVGTSMANDIAEKEVIIADSKEVVTEKEESNALKKPTPTECTAIKFYYYNHLISQGATQQQASAGSYSVYFNCMGQTL